VQEQRVAGLLTDPPFLAFGSTINYSGLTQLSVTGGPIGLYTYQVTDTRRMNNLMLRGGTAPGIFNVQGTTAGTSTTINAATSVDTVNVGSATNTLDPIQGGITVNGRGGNNTLNIRDDGTAASQDYSVYADSVHRINVTTGTQNMGAIGYSGIN